MTVQRIIKMEFFKFFHEKAYLLAFGIMALINIIWTVVTINVESIDALLGSSADIEVFLMLSLFLLIIANFILLYWYPFHILSVDYNNDVLALMMASGIKRKHLFYAKLVATICLSVLAALVLLLIPAIIFVLKLQLSSSLWTMMTYSITKGHAVLYVIDLIIGYLTTVTLMLLACTWMRGAKKAILVFIGLTWVYQLVTNLIVNLVPIADTNITGHYCLVYGLEIIAMILFGYLTQRMMAKQNL